MERKSMAIFGLGVMLALLASIQIVDPNFGIDRRAEIDDTAVPEDAVRHSIQSTLEQSFSYEMYFSEGRNLTPNETNRLTRVEVEEWSSEYYSVGPLGEERTYGNDAATWKKFGQNQSWTIHPLEHRTIKSVITNPFTNLDLKEGSVIVVQETDLTIQYRVNNTTLTSSGAPGSYTTITVNKESGYVVAATSVPPNESIEAKYVHLRLYDIGDTMVTRPDDIGFSIQELFWDIVRGPLNPFQ